MTTKKIKYAEHLGQKISKKTTIKSVPFSPLNKIENQGIKEKKMCNPIPIRCENGTLLIKRSIKY